MLWNRLSRGAGLWACVALISAGLATAQDTHQVPGLEKGRIYPPPTFFAPPSRATNGAIIVNPAHMPPGVPMPQVIWQNGDQQHEVVKPSDHWLGLQCGKIGPALRAQLGLDENQGVLVEAIVDESPAAKAGLEKYDVLVQAGDRTLSKVQDLIDEVDAVKDGKLAVELIRKGRRRRWKSRRRSGRRWKPPVRKRRTIRQVNGTTFSNTCVSGNRARTGVPP
jgi:membrane-associated protease RseP (regulator of RpoE activity)